MTLGAILVFTACENGDLRYQYCSFGEEAHNCFLSINIESNIFVQNILL
jgi:hypothetical protein